MAAQREITRSGPGAYDLARKAVEAMKRHQVWPTPVNFKLWLDYVADPAGPSAVRIDQLLQAGEPITEDKSEALALALSPHPVALASGDPGRDLDREMAVVAGAIAAAHRTSQSYGASLEGATRELAAPKGAPDLRRLLDGLAEDTQVVKAEHKDLARQLYESTVEAGRLRDRLEEGRKEAQTDSLTSLPNRKAFDEALERAWRSASAGPGGALVLAMIDIDHFKRFNDTWGHQTGDHVLRFVAGVIGRAATPPRFAGRYGGEEFGMIFEGEALEAAVACVEAIRHDVSAAVLKRRAGNEQLGALTLSAGLAPMRPGETVHALVERADAALYAAKAAGRNRVSQ